MSGGATSGIPAPSGSDAARFAPPCPFDASAALLCDPSKAVAKTHVSDVLPASSRLAIEGKAALDPTETYKATLVSLPTPPLCFLLEGDAAACAMVREALKTASPEGKPSFFIREVSNGETPEFRIVARDGRFAITRSNDERPLVGKIDGLNAAGAKQVVSRLEHIARWTQTAQLKNPASTIRPNDVKLTILVDGEEVSGREVRLEYRLQGNKQVPPTFQVSMTNNSQRRLFCGLLDLTQRYQVDAGLIKAGCVKLEPGETAWGYLGEPIAARIPDDVWKQGVIEYNDLLKLIVCTEDFDAKLLEQPALDLPRSEGATKGFGRNGSLNRLMKQVQTRGFGEVDADSIDDWMTTEVSFTTVRPLPATPLAAQGQAAATLGSGVKLEGHPSLEGKARLASAPLSTRDIGNITLPRLLYDDPSVCQPLRFTTSRGSDPGLSVLELTDVNDTSLVTPDAPLRVTVPMALQTNEHVVPVAYDAEFFSRSAGL